MRMDPNTIGAMGETIAAKYLKEKGYIISAMNYHSRYGEIDIVAENNEIVIFVEVKTRSANSIAAPVEFVNRRKRQKIIATAQYYICNNAVPLFARFDIIEIVTTGSYAFCDVTIRHIENAFGADDC